MYSFTRSGTSFTVLSISDLDSYTIQYNNFSTNSFYMSTNQDEFGFDPPL